MSEDNSAKSRKAKKAERDAARRQGGKKRKAAEDEVPNLPGDEQEEDNAAAITTEKSQTQTKSKKRKYTSGAEGADGVADAGDATFTQPKRKRTKSAPTTATKDGDESTTTTAPAKSRFIVFVGNLPYTTTDSSLRAHFAKLEPFTLRHRTEPKSNKSKGFAFLEFENYDRMKTCLKLYHHSMFDPDEHTSSGSGSARRQPSGRGGRRINVELTAGGGGKTEGRKEKIRVKNQRLEEQRKRRTEQEQKTAERQAAKKGAAGAKTSGGDVDNSASSGIHPSRLAQMAR